MNVIIIIIILLFMYFMYNQENFNSEDEQSYYIDSNRQKHIITKLPLKLENITELKYASTSSSKIKFVTTKGYYNTLISTNQINIINNRPTTLQLFHIQNKTPFSGILM
jgi:hypothetical protein